MEIVKKEMETIEKVKIIKCQNIILVDASYFIFHRVHALLVWWKCAKKETLDKPDENKEFVEKFTKSCIQKLLELPLKIIPKDRMMQHSVQPLLIIAKDCPREDIWRTAIYPEYKDGRANTPYIGLFFQTFYDIVLPELKKEIHVLNQNECLTKKSVSQFTKNVGKRFSKFHLIEHERLEADDCIAITVNWISQQQNMNYISILASDKDYLQLAEKDTICIFDANFHDLTEKKSSMGSNKSSQDLLYKIIIGDKSDNIPGIFQSSKKTYGPLFIKKLCEGNRDLLDQLLTQENKWEHYHKNELLVDFSKIPENHKEEFINKYFDTK